MTLQSVPVNYSETVSVHIGYIRRLGRPHPQAGLWQWAWRRNQWSQETSTTREGAIAALKQGDGMSYCDICMEPSLSARCTGCKRWIAYWRSLTPAQQQTESDAMYVEDIVTDHAVTNVEGGSL